MCAFYLFLIIVSLLRTSMPHCFGKSFNSLDSFGQPESNTVYMSFCAESIGEERH